MLIFGENMNKKVLDGENQQEGERTLTPEIQKSIDDLIYQKKSIKRDQEAYSEAAEVIAEKLGIKKADLNRRVDLIIKEEEKGGEIKSKENELAFVETYFLVKQNSEYK